MDNSGKTFFAFLAGAAAGAALGLILAPEKGDVTREKLSRQADQLLNDLEEQWEVGSAKLRHMANNVLDEAERMTERTNGYHEEA